MTFRMKMKCQIVQIKQAETMARQTKYEIVYKTQHSSTSSVVGMAIEASPIVTRGCMHAWQPSPLPCLPSVAAELVWQRSDASSLM